MGNFEEELKERQKTKDAIYASIYEYHTTLLSNGLYKDQASIEKGLKLAEETAKRLSNEPYY